MKTIIENSTKVSLYLLEDDVPVTVKSDCIEIGGSEPERIEDPNTIADGAVIENVVNEPNWYARKYLYDSGWSLNPNYIEKKEEDKTDA